MYSKIIINTLLILSLFALQFSFINGLPAGLSNFNLILVALVYMLIIFGLNLTVWWSLGLGLLFDIFSFMPFGLYLITLSITVMIAYFLLTHFFTNRSLYSSLALVGLATVIYEILINSLYYALALINDYSFIRIDQNFWAVKLYQVGLNSLASLVLFYLAHFISRRFKPVFLIKRSK